MRYQDIDWNRMWQENRRHKSWKRKKSMDWNKRAAGFAERNLDSPYIDRFLGIMKPEPEWTVLDIGSGPGTLAIPLARIVKTVTAVDFSADMLDQLRQRAAQENLTNIRTVQASWEDDWLQYGISPHQVAIASRSLSVDDLAAALSKLNDHATGAVFIGDRVGAGPFDPDIFAAVGRKFEAGPDYIYTVNLLYQMGIHAHVDFITLEAAKNYPSPQKALESCAWMLDDMTPEEEAKLSAWLGERLVQTGKSSWQLHRRHFATWAVIWWRKP